jgi:hypothetical protein
VSSKKKTSKEALADVDKIAEICNEVHPLINRTLAVLDEAFKLAEFSSPIGQRANKAHNHLCDAIHEVMKLKYLAENGTEAG